MNQNVMIVEDDKDIREGINILLDGEGYNVTEVDTGEKALHHLNSELDLVILDVMMPGINGYKTCKEIRKISNVPILFITANTMDSDKTMGLMSGGDDYLTKPFSYSELLSRVKALIRRYQVYGGKIGDNESQYNYIISDDLRIDENYNEVWKADKEINLTNIEYDILVLLAKHKKKIFTAQNIYETVWDEPYFYTANSTVMVHIRKLRLKVEDNPKEPKHLKTVWGRGYKFE